jgi:hypothetical protein
MADNSIDLGVPCDDERNGNGIWVDCDSIETFLT